MGKHSVTLDLLSLAPPMELTRRAVIGASLATGFALAVQPVSAQTITTGSEGLTAGEVKIPTTDAQIPAYRAMPVAGGPFPVVLVVQEVFGVHEHIKDLCRRLAKSGYFAVATELYARQGDVSKLTDMKDVTAIVKEVPNAQVMSDLDATLAWAKSTGNADVAHAAVTGFCWGGGIVWLYAAHNPKLRAGVAWYGPLNREATALQPQHPLNIAGELKVPVLGLYAGLDPHVRFVGFSRDYQFRHAREIERDQSSGGSDAVRRPTRSIRDVVDAVFGTGRLHRRLYHVSSGPSRSR